MNTDETDMYLSVGSFQKENQTYTNRLCGGCCPSPSTWQLIRNTINGLPRMTSRTHCSWSCQLGEIRKLNFKLIVKSRAIDDSRGKLLARDSRRVDRAWDLRHGPTGPGSSTSAAIGASPRLRLKLNKIIIRLMSTVKCYFRLYSPKNWEFRTICQLVTCNDRRPRTGLGLRLNTIIAYAVKRQ
ncbi:hypothetical protein TNCV_1104891 [Trichonephila clavipes]|nr:hypothetical protein TNCV_1104891 [Trichonephila clavipes]